MSGTEIEVFDFEDLPVRVVMIDGEPWFVATDLAKILGYRDASSAVRSRRRNRSKFGSFMICCRGSTTSTTSPA